MVRPPGLAREQRREIAPDHRQGHGVTDGLKEAAKEEVRNAIAHVVGRGALVEPATPRSVSHALGPVMAELQVEDRAGRPPEDVRADSVDLVPALTLFER